MHTQITWLKKKQRQQNGSNSVTQLKPSCLFSKSSLEKEKPVPLLSQICVISSGLSWFVTSHEVQQLFLLPAPHWLSVLITNTNSAPWCLAKLAEVRGAGSARPGGGRALPYASCHTLAEVTRQGIGGIFGLPDRCTKTTRQPCGMATAQLRIVEN